MEVMEGRDFCWMKAMEGYDCGFINEKCVEKVEEKGLMEKKMG